MKNIKNDRNRMLGEVKTITRKSSNLDSTVSKLHTQVVAFKMSEDESEKIHTILSSKIVELSIENEQLPKTKKQLDEKEKECKKLHKLLELTDDRLNKSQKMTELLKKQLLSAYYNKGVIFQSDKQWRKAIQAYQKALEVNPLDTDAHFNLALIYETIYNDRKQAIDHYTMYLDLKPYAEDAVKVRKCINDLSIQERMWEAPNYKCKGIGERINRW